MNPFRQLIDEMFNNLLQDIHWTTEKVIETKSKINDQANQYNQLSLHYTLYTFLLL